jgi:hypothetical protein
LRQLGGAINVAVISGQQEHLPWLGATFVDENLFWDTDSCD